jgi:transposase
LSLGFGLRPVFGLPERLVQIIRNLQCHRFGRRAETLPADQLLLALEDVEQIGAETEAGAKSETVRAEGVGGNKAGAIR